ncbi:hypothetical protein DOE59_20385 [Salmonella enterica subsp. diarizonae serovar 48:i:z]|uniref:Uncharacterized protein n=2 Tax=Salmonella enterica TaxID=28901 RepID=A0A7U5YIR6_SALDZ|nr:hypothetical protein DOE59_20385 [Salmonella enterica subsp. diarizonae serovar 48:i:z]AXD70800.1 hypothetical protein CHC34_07315 [Salmonella enterica]EAA4453089.1 hypothetical protein [Salmonella enterica subsp. diarizonae]EDW6118979.1 hypothetical protein [Salmonella enterica subsp. salamae]EAM2669489.1 hypothetical protein [Salmonella enterica]
MAGGLFAKLSLIIHGRLLFESSSPILTLCIRVHTRVNRAETRLHRLTLSSSSIFTKANHHVIKSRICYCIFQMILVIIIILINDLFDL